MVAAKCFSQMAATILVISALTLPNSWGLVKRNVDRALLRKLFKCPACATVTCSLPPSLASCQPVLEPGVCACCQVCARTAGELCGLSAGRCGKGLSCRPLPGDPDPLGAILSGNAVCM